MIFGGLPIKVDSIGNLRESLSNLKISPVKINPYGLNGVIIYLYSDDSGNCHIDWIYVEVRRTW